MKPTRTLGLAVLAAAGILGLHAAWAQPGVAFPKHSHPGEELVYVVEGTLEYIVAGKPLLVLAE